MGVQYTGRGLRAAVTHSGRPLTFTLTSFAVPIASAPLVKVFEQVQGELVQCVPIHIDGCSGFEVVNPLRVVDCLDEKHSEFIKWTTRDHRADLAGSYRQVTKLVIDPGRVPDDLHAFRIKGWEIVFVVSAALKSAMESAGCFGARFTSI